MVSIKTKITAVMLFIVMALSALIIFISTNTNDNYKNLQMQRCQALVDAESQHVDRMISAIEDNAKALALMGKLLYESEGELFEIGRTSVLENFESNNIAIGGGIWYEPYFADPNRELFCFYAFREEDGTVFFDESFESDIYYYPTQNWYLEIRKGVTELGEEVVWTPPYFDDTGTHALMTTAGSGIYSQDQFVGMSTVDWELDAIADSIAGIRPTENSFALFADEANDTILGYTGAEKDVVGQSLSFLPWFKDTTTEKLLHLDGNKYFVFSDVLKNNMIIQIFVPEHELFAFTNETMLITVIVLVLAGILIVIGSYFMLNIFINRPISYLAAKAEEIGNGNLDAEIYLRSRDEFGRLAVSFTQMTSSIKQHIQSLAAITAEKERIGAELNVATEIQASLLPSIFPPFPGRIEFDLYAMMRPAKEVGGDFYDFFLIDESHLALVIADVSGKGVPAALFMVIAKTLIKNHAQMNMGTAEILCRTNDQLCQNNDVGMFVTAFVSILNLKDGTFTYANAGHNPPLICRKNGVFEPMVVKPGFVLAGMEGMSYLEGKDRLLPGECLYLYTDGVTEAENTVRELFGMDKLIEIANKTGSNDVGKLLSTIEKEIDQFAGDAPQFDDITMLAVRYLGNEAGDIGQTESENTQEYRDALTLPALLENTKKMTDFVERLLDEEGVQNKVKAQLLIATEEIFTNIARYAYDSSTGDATLEIAIQKEKRYIQLTFVDTGKPYNPLEKQDPDVTLSAEERGIGGLGIYMVKKSMDECHYQYQDGKNRLTIIKCY